MTAIMPTRSWRMRNLVAVSAVLGVAALVHGFSLPLLSLVLQRQGVGTTMIGLSTAVQYLAVLAAAPFVPRLMARQGPVPMMAWSLAATTLLLVAILIMLCASVALPWVIPYAPWNTVFMFVFGGTFAALYIIPLTMLGRRFKGADLSAAASVFSVMFCFGAVAGPPLSGAGMAFLGNDGMRWALVLLYALALPLPIIGLIRRWQA